ncbi:hypothetical protein AXX17_AT4G05980 [Arabidopsis thaliana]|uniref:Uncharacterized protein n=1 Tax=Arabidopsis thaliana TaxID=3702 RepID=A0A178V4I5_ARATH|nr:hypothetical protein AXX17_AT4G05980 [Arabidopsis thaliana]
MDLAKAYTKLIQLLKMETGKQAGKIKMDRLMLSIESRETENLRSGESKNHNFVAASKELEHGREISVLDHPLLLSMHQARHRTPRKLVPPTIGSTTTSPDLATRRIWSYPQNSRSEPLRKP